MSWLKGSDTAINHPATLAPLAWEPEEDWPVTDGLLSVLLFGMVSMCATYSAGQDTDYVIHDATIAAQVRDPRWRLLARLAARAGYWERLASDDGWLLIDDDLLFHIRLRAEKEWERAQKADTANPGWTVPVRQRDGDCCRYCRKVVNWRDRTKGGRGGTYDHRIPGQPAKSIEDLVVACRGCNSRRRDDRHALTLLPAPESPWYGTDTVAFLAGHDITVELSTGEPPRPVDLTDPATSDPAASGTTHTTATPPPAGHRDQRPAPADTAPSIQDTRDGTAPSRPHRAPRAVMPSPTAPAPRDPAPGGTPHPANNADQHKRPSVEPAARQASDASRAGSGRAGTGNQLPGPPTTDQQTSNRADRRPRGRRGRRGRTLPPPAVG